LEKKNKKKDQISQIYKKLNPCKKIEMEFRKSIEGGSKIGLPLIRVYFEKKKSRVTKF
jgi:hypothetical protein